MAILSSLLPIIFTHAAHLFTHKDNSIPHSLSQSFLRDLINCRLVLTCNTALSLYLHLSVRLLLHHSGQHATSLPYSGLLTVPCSYFQLSNMARKRPAPEAIEPTTASKRGRTSMTKKTPAARTQETARKRVVAQKKPRQTVHAPTQEEIAEYNAEEQATAPIGQAKTTSTEREIAAPKNQETTTATRPNNRRKQTAPNKNQKATASTKPKRAAAPKSRKATASTRQKQTTAPENQKTPASTRQKRAAVPTEEQEAPPTKKQKQSISTAAEHAPSKTQVPFVTPPPEAKAAPTRSYVYNFEFFEDMAKTIASNFPFVEFAARHSCNIHEVARVISAIIVGPLSDPSFDWYDNEDLTIPSYVTMMTEAWERHYQKILVANIQPVESDDSTHRTEDSDESDDGSSSDSDSDAASSSSSDDSCLAPVYLVDEAKDEVSEEVRATVMKAVREPPLNKPKYVPVERRRVHVYKDEWGSYVPVPTKEEQGEQERRHWSEKETRRIRQNRGRGMLGPSSQMQDVPEELDVELEEENFGDMELEMDPNLRRAVENPCPAFVGGNLGEQFGAFMF
ncbi:predicted protein [Aspergillus terreus NIH2624]|uniref:Uncharacterized protein n=1 Tax=Aspergillus terreus (strain NIH 2624 / FGSC A1156) TaxID=341663 RepID=Q0CAG5_ASPTN|nr:uncharacterized protein ATEG_09319 [Aspergillus terreus NIH2624]EAU30456.1 predicted protein [Aspergillus terreus NIH2624]